MGVAPPPLELALVALLQSTPPPTQPVPAQPPAGSHLGPEHSAAELAAGAFAFGCLQRVDDPSATFAKRSDGLGAELAQDHPSEAAFVTLDGDDGKGCRVRLRGPDAQMMWSAWRSVPAIFAPRGGTGCLPLENTELRVRARCDDAASPPHRWEVAIERSSLGADATVSAIVRPTP